MAKKRQDNDGDDQFHERTEFAPEELAPQSGLLSDKGYKQTGWKGFEEEEEDEDPALVFGSRREPSEDDDLDMTPMVDVTFLLLIFFMVTASFTLQKSIEQSQANDDASTNTIETPEDTEDYVEVIIDQTNTFYVVSREEEIETPSVREMRSKVRDAKQSLNAKRMLITAHTDSKHSMTVAAWDAAQAAELFEVQTRVTEEDF